MEEIYAHIADPMYPVSNITAFEAAAYCAYMGKRLPSDYQWTKAARGGLTIGGRPNPSPHRLYPWGGDALNLSCVNLKGLKDGFSWTAPVDALSCGDSPYGIRQLAGNVQEWISRDGQSDREKNPLHALRGGYMDSPPDHDQTTTIFRNHRDPRGILYAEGLRCVVDDPKALP